MRPPTRAPRRPLAALVALLLLVTLAGCGSDGSEGGDRNLGDIVREAIEEAKERREQASGTTGGQRQRDVVLRGDTRTAFDYEEYQRTLSATIALLEEYWSTALPQAFGARYTKPARYLYYRSDEGGGPSCGGQQAPPKNAFYCPPGDFIAWDESGLMIPYYVGGGDFAAAFVLAHEFAHAMQVRLQASQQMRVGVLRELQADCFAGAWSRSLADRRLLQAGDLDEATTAVFSARDVPGTPWTDPQAHGSGFERVRAFGDGYEGGPTACGPARARSWIVSSR